MGEQRRAQRTRVELQCTLRRRLGSPISGHTLDLGPGGMRVCTSRPLSTDEVLQFEVPPNIAGRGRVLRQAGYDSYAVRFEALDEPALQALRRLVAP